MSRWYCYECHTVYSPYPPEESEFEMYWDEQGRLWRRLSLCANCLGVK